VTNDQPVRFVATLEEAQRVITELQVELVHCRAATNNAHARAQEYRALAEERWYGLRDRYVCAAIAIVKTDGISRGPTEMADEAFALANALLHRRGIGIPPYGSAT
jgi:hypothetical protein